MDIRNTELSDTTPSAARLLERALLITILAHALAMLSMVLLLLPGLPGGGSMPAERTTYVAAHPWLWRLGWLPWQLTALSDLFLTFALLRTLWIPRFPAILAVLTNLTAFLLEQPNELLWTTQGVTLAQAASRSGDLLAYGAFETHTYLRIAIWAATGYVITACLWTGCFFKAGIGWPKLLPLSCITWGLFFAVGVGPLLPQGYRPGNRMIAIGNAFGFVLMMVWFCCIAEGVLRRSRLSSPHGRMAAWRYPSAGLVGSVLDPLANSRLVRAFGEWMPLVEFQSDITDVIYANYLVEAERLAPLVPAMLELQRLGSEGKQALFTHLTYRHGHFGPRLPGPLRRFLPSPVQSNWRIYIRDPRTKQEGIYFVTTAMNQTLPALLARLLPEGIPMHLVKQGAVTADPEGTFTVSLDPGIGSAPDLTMRLRPSAPSPLPPSWQTSFESFHDLLAYCVPQDRAMSSQPWYGRITRQEIALGIPLESCEPLTADVISRAAQAIVGDAQPICFRVPIVTFRFEGEKYDFEKKCKTQPGMTRS